MLPSRVVLSLFEGSYPASVIFIHIHPSQWLAIISIQVNHPKSFCAHISYFHTSSDVSCRLMRDTSMPSFKEFVPVDINTLSRNLIKKLVSTLDLVVLSGRFPHIQQWTSIIDSCLNESRSVRHQHTYSHSLDCTMYLGTHHHHQWTPSHWLIGYFNA